MPTATVYVPLQQGSAMGCFYGFRVFDSIEQATAPDRGDGAVCFLTKELAEDYCAWAVDNFPWKYARRDGWTVRETTARVATWPANSQRDAITRAFPNEYF
ncbi:hypothetical protein [Microbispora sp. NPDC049125]|uniref:hypothetical protein n=1 Tax=Microbispora sp. NPDC049125 TaxID=3154929 RepID=UPI003465FEDD